MPSGRTILERRSSQHGPMYPKTTKPMLSSLIPERYLLQFNFRFLSAFIPFLVERQLLTAESSTGNFRQRINSQHVNANELGVLEHFRYHVDSERVV